MVCIQRTTMENVTTYFIVGYAGGTAGDLITALLNPTDVELDGTRVIVPDHRVKLKKPRRFADDEAKNKYIQEFKNTVSLSSHDLEYHIRKHHPFIGITVRYKLAYWAAERFKDLHSDNIWRQMGNGTVEDYAEAMAFDYTMGYLDNLLNFVYDAVSNLEHAQLEGEVIHKFKEELRAVRLDLFHERSKTMSRLHTILAVKQSTKQIENQVNLLFADYRDRSVE